MQLNRFLRTGVLLVAMAGTLRVSVAASPSPGPSAKQSPAFSEFDKRVQQYVKLQKSVPRLRTTPRREEIVGKRHALALRIREMRAGAKPGDIFTPEASDEFRHVIQAAFQAPNVRKTVRDGEPVPGWHLIVNGDYPEHLPFTTVPPTLLLRLPQLPSGVAYRLVGHDFVLEDTEARLIIDFIPGVIP